MIGFSLRIEIWFDVMSLYSMFSGGIEVMLLVFSISLIFLELFGVS